MRMFHVRTRHEARVFFFFMERHKIESLKNSRPLYIYI